MAKSGSKRDKNKKLVAAWVEKKVVEALKNRADKDEIGNSTLVVYRTSKKYLAPELAEINKTSQST